MPAIRRGVADAREPAPIPADRLGVMPGPAILGVLETAAAFLISSALSRSILRDQVGQNHCCYANMFELTVLADLPSLARSRPSWRNLVSLGRGPSRRHYAPECCRRRLLALPAIPRSPM